MTHWDKTTRDGVPGRPPVGKPYLCVLAGRHAGRLYPLEPGRPCLIGRSSECNPRFPSDPTISLVHAEITVDTGRVLIRDMSRNGIVVGERFVSHERVPVENGDCIVLSNEQSTLRLEWLSGEEVELRIQLFRDPLTRCWRPSHLESRLADLLDSPEDILEPLSVVMMDVDHFGLFNKQYGQNIGNDVLRAVAACLTSTVSELHAAGDVARDGGEEFLVLLPGCSAERGRAVAEAARERIAALQVPHDGQMLSVTASFGGATLQPARGQTLAELRGLANAEEWRAKRGGRNRVIWEGDPE